MLVEQHALVARLLARGEHGGGLGEVVGGDEVERSAAHDLVDRVAAQLGHRRVRVEDEPVAVEHDALGARLHEFGEPVFGLARQRLGAAVLGDVGDEHEGAERGARGRTRGRTRKLGRRGAGLREVRQQVHFEPAGAPVGPGHRALVGDRGAMRHHVVDMGPDLAHRLGADHLLERRADDRRFIVTEGPRVLLVRELAAPLGGRVVGDEHGHVVGEQPKQFGLRRLLRQRARLRVEPRERLWLGHLWRGHIWRDRGNGHRLGVGRECAAPGNARGIIVGTVVGHQRRHPEPGHSNAGSGECGIAPTSRSANAVSPRPRRPANAASPEGYPTDATAASAARQRSSQARALSWRLRSR